MNPILKIGVTLAINSQDDLNELAEISGAFVADGILINDEYIAYLDFDGSVDGSINVRKLVDFHEEYPQYKDMKLKSFKKWKRSLK